MTNRWDFAPLEYLVGWRAFGWDQLSYPLQYRSTAPMRSDYEQECIRAAASFKARFDDDLYSAFVTLGAPEARVYGCGFAGPNNARKVRIHAAARGRVGVLVVQDPGPDHHSGGTIHVSRIPVDSLAQQFVAALPPMNPGREPKVEVPVKEIGRDRSDDDEEHQGSWLEPTRRLASPMQGLTKLTSKPRVGIGQIEVYSGPTMDLRDTGNGREMFWIDNADDGRYLARQNQHTLVVGGVAAADLTGHLQRLITNAAQAYVNALANT